MSSAGFKFDASQQYQLDAINAVTGLFDGQPADAEKLVTTLRGSAIANEALQEDGALDIDLTQEVGAIGNNLILSRELVLSNLQHVQDSTGLEVSSELFDNLKLDFDVEMETGTGKTYVYLRTIFELAQKYNFTKFIILVPSVAIREGVATSIRLMKKHFSELYPSYPFDYSVYSGKNAEEVQSFATSTNVQILIMTMSSIAEKATAGAKGSDDAEARLIINQRRDKLNGFRPIDYLQATHPVVIMDEPQNMEGQLAQEALERLKPAFTLRYSATHKTRRNVIYRLDPVDAHDLGLVKQIVVAEVQQQGADAAPYLKLVSVKSSPEFVARLELSVLTADGTYARREVTVKPNVELSGPRVSGNPAYDGWRINGINMPMDRQPGSIELTLHGEVHEGETIGGATGAVYKEMIRETIREHFRKQKMLKDSGIKVLSLFFVDKVASYMGDGESNDSADGDFAKWFDELFIEERSKDPKIQELLPQEPVQLRKAYFASIKRGNKVEYSDSKEGKSSKADDDSYELIMKDKERLLDEDEPVRFIFSHSALREGWDNPNVFQICTLREMGTETQRRQTLGRGLRLPVKRTPTGYERVGDRSIATLTVIANESYKSFANSLQKEYKDDGIEIGRVRMNEFARILRQDADGVATEQPFGYQWSAEVREDLTIRGFLTDGVLTNKFTPQVEGFNLDLEEKFQPYEAEILEILGNVGVERYIKPKSSRVSRKLNKEIYSTPEFDEFWHAISAKSTYRVKLDTPSLVSKAIASIKEAPEVQALRIQVTKAAVKVLRGGAKGQEQGTRISELKGSYDLPDVITELQEATSLTRGTIIDILTGSDRLDEFINNPNDFISMVKRCLLTVLAQTVVDGIEYEKIAGSIYELRELQQDGLEEKERFLDQMYHVQNGGKTDFDYVVFDSDVERQFAEFLDGRDDVKYFMKLPPKFKIPTPVGDYNPDWAIIKREGDKDQIYMIRETKGTNDFSKLRPSEVAKIKSAKKHFAAIGAVSYENNHPGDWKI